MTDYEGVDVQNRSSRPRRQGTRSPRCRVDGCNNPRAVTQSVAVPIPLCWPHMTEASRIENEARRQSRLRQYTQAAKEAGRKPEEMFWAPEIFECQAAQELQQRFEDRRDLFHYRSLVESGQIKSPTAVKRTPRDEKDGTVYYLRVGAYIKIGWTSDLTKRMKSYSPDSVLLATEPGTRKDEQRRHRMFAVHRTHGREWYAMVPSLTHHIQQVTDAHGSPDPVAFAARPVAIPQPRTARPITPRGWTGHTVVGS